MNAYEQEMPNGYLETIQKGVAGVRSLSGRISRGKGTREEQILRLKEELASADAVIVGAGAGLSTAAGFIYSGERFGRYFPDFEKKYGYKDMYYGGFQVMNEPPEVFWAYWARYIYINRYTPAPKPVYEKLLTLLRDKDYFVITTNVDHQFQKAGFDKKRLFYTQGDYGLFQSTDPSNRKTWDNETWVMEAMEAQGFLKDDKGVFIMPENGRILAEIPKELIPKCPDDGMDVRMNLRSDDTFVEDEGWRKASAAYSDFLRRHRGLRVLYLEAGVGNNTPVIIKYPFWQMVREEPKAFYACLDYDEAYCPEEIGDRAVCIEGDTADVLEML